MAISLTKSQQLVNKEAAANSMIYKVLSHRSPKYCPITASGFCKNSQFGYGFADIRCILPAIVHWTLLSSNSLQGLQHCPFNVSATPHRFSGRLL